MKSIFKKTLCSIMLFCLLFLCVGVVTKVSAADKGEWKLVTDVSNISVGDKVIVVNTSSEVAMSTNQKTNNRGQVSITINNNVATINDNVQQLTIEKGTKDNTFAFSTGSGYLYAASSSKNYLKTESEMTDNSSWNITIAASGDATIKAQGKNTKNSLRYNSSSTLFSCYSSGQVPVQLYKYEVSLSDPVKVSFVNNNVEISNETIEKGSTVAKPTDPELEGNLFLGWFEEGQDTEFDFNTPITTDITLVARWQQISWYTFLTLPTLASLNISYTKTSVTSGVNVYTKVTAALEDYSGDYLIVYEDSSDLKIFNGVDTTNGYVSVVKPENDYLIETEELSAYKVIVKKMGNGYSIQITGGTNKGKYLAAPKSNGITFSSSATANTIEVANEVATISNNSRTFKFNNDSNQMRFRYFGSAQQDIKLYKLSETTITKEDFTFSNASLRFGLVELPVSDYENMVAEGATFGIALTKGESIDIATATKFDCTPVRVNANGVEDANGEYYQFAVVINDITK